MRVLRTTERLVLHRYSEDAQVPAVAAWLSDPEVARHLLVSFDPERGLEPNGERFRRNFAEAWERLGFGGVLVSLRDAGPPVGFIALKGHGPGDAAPGSAFEIYFGLARRCWGRGLMSEAMAAYLDELAVRLRPRAVYASINRAQNPVGCRVLEKLGFVFERWLPLPDFVRGPLAVGSLELEVLRVAGAGRERKPWDVLAEAAFRTGQLLDSAGREAAEAERRLLAAAGEGGFFAGPGREEVARRVREALDAGRREARYAVFRRAA